MSDINGGPGDDEDDEELERELEKARGELRDSEIRRLEVVGEEVTGARKIRQETDIVRRARHLFEKGHIQYSDLTKVRSGDMMITKPKNTEENKWIILDTMFEGVNNKPHVDEFRGRIVDHEGVLMDDHYYVGNWLKAFSAAGLKETSAVEVRRTLREWALQHRSNDLIERMSDNIPEWDGVPRMERAMIELFECEDNELNIAFSKYFWLSLYARLMMPGTFAPIVLSLFGVQDCGKSFFGKRLCQIITGDEDADSVQLNLDGDKTNFLREITGASVIASVGEMTGFTRGDLNKIKDFITRTSDKMHHKFEGHFTQMRQWITVMDGNKYEGLQRDDTGNRRFYPVFCGQLPDELGQPNWREDFSCGAKISSPKFEHEFWLIMSEVAAWLDDNGMAAYLTFARGVSRMVFEFSNREMHSGRGTIRDDVFEINLVPLLKKGPKVLWNSKSGMKSVGVISGEFKKFFQDEMKHTRPNWRHFKQCMQALGGEEYVFTGGYAGFIFPKFKTIESFVEKIGEHEGHVADGEYAERVEVDAGGGF